MKKKIIFLDIDGTLMDFDGKLPVTAKKALLKAEDRWKPSCVVYRAGESSDISGTFRDEF